MTLDLAELYSLGHLTRPQPTRSELVLTTWHQIICTCSNHHIIIVVVVVVDVVVVVIIIIMSVCV